MVRFIDKIADNAQSVISAIIYTISGWITAVYIYFAPVQVLWLCIAVAWGANFLAGYIAGMREGESFDKCKAKDTGIEVMCYLFIVSLLYFIGERMGDKDLILKGLNIITWAFIYFYAINILKNLCRIVPKSKGLKYCKYVISLEFFRAFPSLKKFDDETIA